MPTSRGKACPSSVVPPLRKVLTRMLWSQRGYAPVDDAEGLPGQRMAGAHPGHSPLLQLRRRGVGRRGGVRAAYGRPVPRDWEPRAASAVRVCASGSGSGCSSGFNSDCSDSGTGAGPNAGPGTGSNTSPSSGLNSGLNSGSGHPCTGCTGTGTGSSPGSTGSTCSSGGDARTDVHAEHASAGNASATAATGSRRSGGH